MPRACSFLRITGRYYRPLLSLFLPIELLNRSRKEHIAAAVEGGFDGVLDDRAIRHPPSISSALYADIHFSIPSIINKKRPSGRFFVLSLAHVKKKQYLCNGFAKTHKNGVITDYT